MKLPFFPKYEDLVRYAAHNLNERNKLRQVMRQGGCKSKALHTYQCRQMSKLEREKSSLLFLADQPRFKRDRASYKLFI